MQRPGRLHISWKDENTLQIDADAGTQTRLLHFDQTPRPQPAVNKLAGILGRAMASSKSRPRRSAHSAARRIAEVVTTKMKPGYIRKNGVPYSENAVLTEYMNILTGTAGGRLLVCHGIGRRPGVSQPAFPQDLHLQEGRRRVWLGSDTLLAQMKTFGDSLIIGAGTHATVPAQ